MLLYGCSLHDTHVPARSGSLSPQCVSSRTLPARSGQRTPHTLAAEGIQRSQRACRLGRVSVPALPARARAALTTRACRLLLTHACAALSHTRVPPSQSRAVKIVPPSVICFCRALQQYASGKQPLACAAQAPADAAGPNWLPLGSSLSLCITVDNAQVGSQVKDREVDRRVVGGDCDRRIVLARRWQACWRWQTRWFGRHEPQG